MGSSGHHHHHRFFFSLSFHLHLHHHHHHHHHQQKSEEGGGGMKKDRYVDDVVPKGYMAVMVGEEQKRRFVIPVMYIYHPLFMDLLKEAEEEYGFHHSGPINIPCNLHHFSHLQSLINKDNFSFYDSHHHICCFKA